MMISVIIPAYNSEKTIKKTIDSVLSQSYQNIEIIVINDGSTDSTLDIVNSIHDSRLQIFSYPNAGLATSRNRGISHCQGEFISFIDADDLWTVDKLMYQYKALEENKNAVVAYSWTDYIDTEGLFLKAGRRVTATGDVYSQLILWNFLENGSNPLIYRQALNQVGSFDESLAAAEDWDMWLRLAAIYEFVLVPQAQILYRLSANSMSANLKRQEAASLKVIERAFNHPKAASLQHLKKTSLAHIYQYLTFKALEVPPKQQQNWIAAQFFFQCIKYKPSLLRKIKFTVTTVFKIALPRTYYHVKKVISFLKVEIKKYRK